VAILLDVALFMVLYSLLPHGVSTWREILPGAIGAGLLWEIAKKAFLFFVSTYISVYNLIYGSVAAIIAFPGLGLSERPHLSLGLFLERVLLPTKAAAIRSSQPKKSVIFRLINWRQPC
jgi:hypothetical protein